MPPQHHAWPQQPQRPQVQRPQPTQFHPHELLNRNQSALTVLHLKAVDITAFPDLDPTLNSTVEAAADLALSPDVLPFPGLDPNLNLGPGQAVEQVEITAAAASFDPGAFSPGVAPPYLSWTAAYFRS